MNTSTTHKKTPRSAAKIVREYGPFPEVDGVHGVTHDGTNVWFAHGQKLSALDTQTGKLTRSLDVGGADAGTAFDGTVFYQLAGDQIHKIDPASGKVLSSIPAPSQGRDSGMAWSDGSLWVGEYREGRIHEIDPSTGAIRRTLKSDRFVTGISWIDGELWHGTGNGDRAELRRVDPATGDVMEALELPEGMMVSGLEARGDVFYAGGGKSAKVRAISRPARVRP